MENFGSDASNKLENSYDSTYVGIHKMFQHLVEKFGWVVLHRKDPRKHKARVAYLLAIQQLWDDAENAKGRYEEKDKKTDLALIRNKLGDFLSDAKIALGVSENEIQQGGAKRKSKSKSKSKSKTKTMTEKKKPAKKGSR